MRNLLKLVVSFSAESKTWISALGMRERGLLLQSMMAPEAGVLLGSHGATRANSLELLEVSVEFVYGDFEVAKGEFLRALHEIGPPPGARAVHVIFHPEDASFDFDTLAEW